MTDQKEKEFAEGLYINESDKDFIKLKIGINKEEFAEWFREKYKNKDDDYINIDVKESKSGKLYGEVNNWKPNEKKPEPKEELKSLGDSIPEESIPDDIPF